MVSVSPAVAAVRRPLARESCLTDPVTVAAGVSSGLRALPVSCDCSTFDSDGVTVIADSEPEYESEPPRTWMWRSLARLND